MSSKSRTSKPKSKSKSSNTTKIDLVLAARKISVAKHNQEKKSLYKSFKKFIGLKGGKNKTRRRSRK